jgi:hypothetical protein
MTCVVVSPGTALIDEKGKSSGTAPLTKAALKAALEAS